MDRRLRKQMLYGTFYVCVLLIIVIGFYFLFLQPAPSCFDNVQNQGELGIDCGGPCAEICLPQGLKQIEQVDRISAFEPDSAHVSLLVRVNNPNIDYASKNFTYTFALYDNQNKLVKSFSGDSYIYGGEVKYLFLPNLALSRSSFDRTELSIKTTEWIPATQFKGPPQILAQSVRTSISGNDLTVDGQVVNSDTSVFPKVLIIAVFRGQYDQSAGVSQTEIENLVPNETRQFSIFYPAIENVDLSGTKLFIYAQRP